MIAAIGFFLRRQPYRSGATGVSTVDPFAPIVLFLFFYVFEFVLPFLYVSAGGEFVSARARTVGLTYQYLEKGMLGGLLFAGGWVASYLFFWRGNPNERLTAIVPRFSLGVASAVYCCALIVFLAMIVSNPALGDGKAEMVQGAAGASLVLAMCLLLSTLAVVIVTDNESAGRASGKGKSMNGTAIVVTLVALSLVALVFLQMRSRALSALMLAIIVLHYGRHRITLTEYMVFMGAAVLGALVISYIELARAGAGYLPSIVDVAFGVDYRRNFDGLYNAALLIQHIDSRREPYDYGWGVIAEVLADVRLVPNAGSTSTRVFFMEEVIGLTSYKAGIALSKVGELYRAGGFVGLLFGGALLGAISKGLYRYLVGVRPLGILSIPLYYFTLLSGVATPRGYIAGKWLFAIILCVMFLGTALIFFKVRVMRRGASAPVPHA